MVFQMWVPEPSLVGHSLLQLASLKSSLLLLPLMHPCGRLLDGSDFSLSSGLIIIEALRVLSLKSKNNEFFRVAEFCFVLLTSLFVKLS